MSSITVFDLETLKMDDEVILKNAPEWSEEEARTRVPKNYKKEEAINGWLEEDRANYRANLLEKAALNPETATIAVAGFMKDGEVHQFSLEDDPGIDPEGEIIEECFFRLRGDCIGWNIHGFDLPFLVKRAWIRGIMVPRTVFNPFSRYSIPDRFLDGMKLWQAGNFKAPFTSLNNALKAVGLPGKPDGKEFASLWREDRTKALEYNRSEVLSQADLYRRMGVDL